MKLRFRLPFQKVYCEDCVYYWPANENEAIKDGENMSKITKLAGGAELSKEYIEQYTHYATSHKCTKRLDKTQNGINRKVFTEYRSADMKNILRNCWDFRRKK